MKNHFLPKQKKKKFFSYLENLFKPIFIISHLPLKYVGYTVYILVLSLLYVSNVHYYDKILKKIAILTEEVKKIFFEYSILEMEYNLAIQPDVLAKRVAHLGLQENTTTPYKIKVDKHTFSILNKKPIDIKNNNSTSYFTHPSK